MKGALVRAGAMVSAVVLCACGDGTGIKETLACVSPGRPGQSIAFFMQRWDYSDGSVMSHCEMADGTSSYDSMAFYSSEMSGADTAQCIISYDLDSSSYGFWTFTVPKGGTIATARYTDDGSAFDGRAVAIDCKQFGPN